MVNGAIRFNKDVWFFITLDESNGDNEVKLEVYDEGTQSLWVLTGVITWED